MRLRDLEWWPPTLSDSYPTGRTQTPPEPAKFKGSKVYDAIGTEPAYLALIVHYQGRDWRTGVSTHPEYFLRRIEATLRGHEGKPLIDLGDLEVVETP